MIRFIIQFSYYNYIDYIFSWHSLMGVIIVKEKIITLKLDDFEKLFRPVM